jgi:hypothetical protein
MVRRSATSLVALASLCLFLGLSAQPALADSGSIAGAAAVVWGQQTFGNTANVTPDANGTSNDYWVLDVTAGDQVTIDWAGQLDNDGNGPALLVFPLGTTDYNVDNTTPLQNQDLNANGMNELQFTVNVTGTMPLDFETGSNDFYGQSESTEPFNFTAGVRHAVVLGVPSESALALHGSLTVGVHNPDGDPITTPALGIYLQMKAPGQSWTNIGTSTPSAGAATISYSIPSSAGGYRVAIRVVAAGAGYTTTVSATRDVEVLKPAAPAHHKKPAKRHKKRKKHKKRRR